MSSSGKRDSKSSGSFSRKVVGYGLALDGLSYYKRNVEFGEQHLPTGDLPCKSWLFKDVLNGIHAGNEPRGVMEHILPQLA